MILIVDDEQDILDVLTDSLAAEGFTDVVATTDPSESLSLISEKDVKLCFIDIGLKKINGVELIQQINVKFPTVKVVAFSGFIDLYKDELDKLTIFSRLSKPFKRVEAIELAKKAFGASSSAARQSPRFVVTVDNEIEIQLTEPKVKTGLIVKSISKNGIGLDPGESFSKFKKNQHLEFVLSFNGFEKFQMKGEIINLNQGLNQLGVVFVEQQVGFSQGLQDFIVRKET